MIKQLSAEEMTQEMFRRMIRKGLEALSEPGLDEQSRRQGRENLEELTAYFEEEDRELRAQIRQALGREE